jgi:aminopeptidase N
VKNIFLVALLIWSVTCFAQKPDSSDSESWKRNYRASATKINDLVNTKLEVRFDFSRSWMYGKAWITLHPHFYSTDTLSLDAKHMTINEVSIIKKDKSIPLRYTYDSLNLRINLDRSYRIGEDYIIYIDYISKPNEIRLKGSAAISGSKGLYFINPLGNNKDKPTQIWTQGETESNSAWFPTIDKPNQKTTDEISITVPDKYQTLSNGLLVNQKKNINGTHTDTWKMDQPHAPYLIMMAIGEYSITRDSYKGKEVSYYVEKEYATVARRIFGLTPEMIGYFSRITGVEYPWQKYAQVTARDYISGAMENTTATLHGEFAQQDARQLIDGNNWEDVIAHELFHQWFGDYVTSESWSNLTVNESFADLSETLWETYKHGKDAGDEHNYESMWNYFYGNSAKKDLVRFYYKDREDMFDLVSYQKGGRILNMLRNYVGDSAFFKSLNLYLNTRKFNSAEAHDLRLAFEEVTGQDLNWFWDQWFFGSGHPKLDISYKYDETSKSASVFVSQTQPHKIFVLPLAIDIYHGSEKKRYQVRIEHKSDTFAFPVVSRPDLINVDGDKIILCEKTDNKTIDNFIWQYKYAGSYVDRREAIDFAARKQRTDPKAMDLLKTALNDRYAGLRISVIQSLSNTNDSVSKIVEPILVNLAKNDPKPLVRASAIQAIGQYRKDIYKELFVKSINDSSYSIAGDALLALGLIDSVAAFEKAKVLSSQNVKGALSGAISSVLYKYANEKEFDSLSARFNRLSVSDDKYGMLQPFSSYLKRVTNTENFKKGIDMIVSFRDTIPMQYRSQVETYFNAMILNSLVSYKQAAGMKEQADYVKSKLPSTTNNNAAPVLSREILKKYIGEFDFNEMVINISLKDSKTLTISFPGQPELELIPLSKTKFAIKFMDGYSVEFISNSKNEISGLSLTSPDEEQVKATKRIKS